MSALKLLLDENLSPRVAQRLREEDGVDVVHVRDRGMLNREHRRHNVGRVGPRAMNQLDLEGMAPVLPEGFRWLPGWLAPGEAAALFELLLHETTWEDQLLRMGGRVVPMPRRTAFYGPHAYAYSGLLHPATCALPPRLDAVRVRIEEASGQPFNTLLMNLYRDGADSVSWHSDDDYPHGGHPGVASLSLGATRRFRIAHKRSRESLGLDLTAGGLLVMEGTSQLDYRHALPKTAVVTAPRINLTFRFMSASNVM